VFSPAGLFIIGSIHLPVAGQTVVPVSVGLAVFGVAPVRVHNTEFEAVVAAVDIDHIEGMAAVDSKDFGHRAAVTVGDENIVGNTAEHRPVLTGVSHRCLQPDCAAQQIIRQVMHSYMD